MIRKGWLQLSLALVALLCAAWPALGAGPVPQPAAATTPVGSFPEWVNFYGLNSTFGGAPLPLGTEIIAYSGSTRCGSFVVSTAGQYGVLPCYRDRPEQPGANPGDTIHFTVNGFEAILRGPDEPIWTFNGDIKHVELEASGAPQTPTGTPTQTTLPTSTPTGTLASPPTWTPTVFVPPTATPTWVVATPTPTTVVQPPTWPAPTWPAPVTPVAPAGDCRERIQDGGFEAGSPYWGVEPSARPATRSTAIRLSGGYAMRLGIVEEPNAQTPSAVRQRLEIPANATYAYLSFYQYALAEADARDDFLEVQLFQPGTSEIVATLWRNRVGNERRWLIMNLDLLAFRGRSVDLYVDVYNDGQGGRSAVYLDDVSFLVCTSGPTGTTPTATPVVPVTPATPWPTPSGACQELLTNGNFEGGMQGWALGQTPRMPVLVTDPRHGGVQAMRTGFMDGLNVESFSSIRQTVTIPRDATAAELTYWTYLLSNSTSGNDHQELVLLRPSDGTTIEILWRVMNGNAPIWNPQRVDLMRYSGWDLVIYYNTYNDGSGGTSAMIIDDISLKVCRPAPTPTLTAIALAMPSSTPILRAADVQAPFTSTPTVPLSLARSTPTAVASKATRQSSFPNAGVIAFAAIVGAIAVAAVLVWLLRGPKKPKPPTSAAATGGGTSPQPTGAGETASTRVAQTTTASQPPAQTATAGAGVQSSAKTQTTSTQRTTAYVPGVSSATTAKPPVTSTSGGKPPVRFETRPQRAVSSVNTGPIYRPDRGLGVDESSRRETGTPDVRSFGVISPVDWEQPEQGAEDVEDLEDTEDVDVQGDEDDVEDTGDLDVVEDGDDAAEQDDDETDEPREDDALPWPR